jgi:hypothetical protein
MYIYKAFDEDTDVLVDQREIVTAPLWSNGQSSLYNIFTGTFSFQGRTSEVISSLYYFARLRWDEFNYTNNASFYSTDATTYGQLKHAWMAPSMGTPGHPETFPTTIGLYDDDENLLAVAKVSKAIKKTFDHEIIFKIKLDY